MRAHQGGNPRLNAAAAHRRYKGIAGVEAGLVPSAHRESIGLSTVIYKEKTVRLISTSEILVHVTGFTNKEGDNHDHTGTGNFDDV